VRSRNVFATPKSFGGTPEMTPRIFSDIVYSGHRESSGGIDMKARRGMTTHGSGGTCKDSALLRGRGAGI
jgi:hypothetical protein